MTALDAVVRPISSADAGALLRFHGHLSARSIRLRYFYPHEDLSPSEVAHFTQIDGEARVALVVERASELIAVGRYDRLDDHRVAEVAFVVADAYQHHGLATMLLHRLADAARSVGIERFIAEVLAENRAMLSVFHDAGFPIESKTECGHRDAHHDHRSGSLQPQRPIRRAHAREPESRLRPTESRRFHPVFRLDSAG